jgi:hypothetical protein
MKTENKALQKLQDMPLADCIAAVVTDVNSKRDEYRSIDGHELASLLGIDDAGNPGPDWSFSWIVPRWQSKTYLLTRTVSYSSHS